RTRGSLARRHQRAHRRQLPDHPRPPRRAGPGDAGPTPAPDQGALGNRVSVRQPEQPPTWRGGVLAGQPVPSAVARAGRGGSGGGGAGGPRRGCGGAAAGAGARGPAAPPPPPPPPPRPPPPPPPPPAGPPPAPHAEGVEPRRVAGPGDPGALHEAVVAVDADHAAPGAGPQDRAEAQGP